MLELHNDVVPAQLELPGTWLTPVGGDNMDDVTRALAAGPPVSDSVAAELGALMRDFPFESFGRRVDSLGTTGDRLLAEATPWGDEVRALLTEFEAALKPYHLSDEAHQAMAFASGIDRLYGLLDELSLIAEPNP